MASYGESGKNSNNDDSPQALKFKGIGASGLRASGLLGAGCSGIGALLGEGFGVLQSLLVWERFFLGFT